MKAQSCALFSDSAAIPTAVGRSALGPMRQGGHEFVNSPFDDQPLLLTQVASA